MIDADEAAERLSSLLGKNVPKRLMVTALLKTEAERDAYLMMQGVNPPVNGAPEGRLLGARGTGVHEGYDA